MKICQVVILIVILFPLFVSCSKPAGDKHPEKIGDWYERIEDRKRVKITGIGTGRDLLDEYYRFKRFKSGTTDTTFMDGRTFAVVMSMVQFSDSSAYLSSPCVRWAEMETQTTVYMGMPSALSVTRFKIIPLTIFGQDYKRVQ